MKVLNFGFIVLPLLGFLINGLFGKSLPKKVVATVGTSIVFICFLAVLRLFFLNIEDSISLMTWLKVGHFHIPLDFYIDSLTKYMLLIITGIGSLIHLYSYGYMKHDSGFYRFFAYLNLFIFSMFLLVMGKNFLILFFGWEGVGLCSYLLIGFWYHNLNYGHAARKAFIMNRIGDLGLLLGIFLLYQNFGTIDFQQIATLVPQAKSSTLLIISICLFIGAMGKSAQIPLYTWLPDAMAGPTPVSALIHAATMVTAGIYLVVRNNVLFAAHPTTHMIILNIGLLTAVFSAFIGLFQNDLKKILAYSTVSQLGFMFVALGVGAYSTAMFHLLTHAFFKALLFLGAGSVIHALSNEQDINKMGGLKNKIKITHITFLIGTLAIAGFPLFSGFFSKDEILEKVFEFSKMHYVVLMFSAILTIIYMFRAYFMVFWGNPRYDSNTAEKLHESPLSMTLPLIVLSFFAFSAGFLNMPRFIGGEYSELIAHYLKVDLPQLHSHHGNPLIMMCIATIIVLITVVLVFLYMNSRNFIWLHNQNQRFIRFASDKFKVDEFYNSVFVYPLEFISEFFYQWMDKKMFRKLFFGSQNVWFKLSKYFLLVQRANLDGYFLYFALSVLALLIIIHLK